MPVTNVEMQSWPSWSELERFDILKLAPHENLSIDRLAERLKIVVVRGSIVVDGIEYSERSVFEATNSISVFAGAVPTIIVPLHGNWGELTGGCGVFTVERTVEHTNRGTPVDYERQTSIDNHYHDCDEFWIIVEGEAVAVSEGTFFHVQAGDCVLTGAGDHHDMPDVTSPVRAVFFETTLLGAKQTGHLWEHTHGPATPARH